MCQTPDLRVRPTGSRRRPKPPGGAGGVKRGVSIARACAQGKEGVPGCVTEASDSETNSGLSAQFFFPGGEMTQMITFVRGYADLRTYGLFYLASLLGQMVKLSN